MPPSACYANVHREVTGQDPAVQTDVSSKATNQALCHAVFRTKSSRSSRIRSVIGFCDTRENTWNVAIPATKATVQQQKIMGIERAARPHVASCLWPNKEINENVIKQNTEGLFSSFFTTSRECEWQLKGNNK